METHIQGLKTGKERGEKRKPINTRNLVVAVNKDDEQPGGSP
jgi:hypothetical protein